MKKTTKVYNWTRLQSVKDSRVISYALKQLKRTLGYEPTPTDLLNVVWDDHFKVIAC